MLPPPAGLSLTLTEEGALCKASLKAFTERLIARLEVPQREAELLRKYDSSRIDGNVYLHFPFCFREAFTTVAIEDLRTIALSGALWMSYMRAQDDTIDKPEAVDPILLFLRDLYLRESIHLLYEIFPGDSAFWSSYSKYFDEYARSVLCEKENHSSVESRYNADEFHRLAKGKAAMAKYPVAALAVLSGEEEKMLLLTESLDWFHVGYQYWDDLIDWKEDLANSRYSLLLARALDHLTPQMRAAPPGQLREKIGPVVYYSGLAEEQLGQAFKCFERACELALAAGCTVWAAHVKTLQKQTVVLAADLRALMSTQTSHG
jgi:hypothetical protein